jgi:hypothetical protein
MSAVGAGLDVVDHDLIGHTAQLDVLGVADRPSSSEPLVNGA